MVKTHTKKFTDNINSITKGIRFYNTIIFVISLSLIVGAIYKGSIVMLSFALAFHVIGWIANISMYLRIIILGQVSQLAYMESKDKE